MENFRLLLKSIRDHWVSLSSMFVPTDMTFFIMCGVGLFILLIPFLKIYPESSPPGSKRNTPKNIQSTEAARSASILPEQFQFFHHQEEPRNEDRATKMRKQRGAPFRFLPSREIKKLQGAFPAHRPHQSKNRPDLSHPAKYSILDSKRCKLSPLGSVPSRMPLKKGPAKCNMHDPIKVGLSVGAKDLPSTSSNTLSKNLEPRTPSLRTNQLSYVNTAQNLFFLDPKTQMKLESNIAHLPLKHCRPQTLELTGLTPPGVPASSLPQPVCPSSPACASKAEYYSKAAKILEKLHHQDPGGKDIEIISATRVQCPPFAHSHSEVQETQRAPLPAASHSTAKAHPDVKQRYLSAQTRAFSFQAKTQQGRTIRGTGRGSLQPTTSPRRAKHAPWKRFKNVASGHPCWSGTMAIPQERIPPSVTEQTSRFVVKDKTHPARKVSLEATEISNGQAINIGSRHFEFEEANRSPCHFQTPTLQHLGDSALNPQVGNEIDFRSSKKPEAWLVVHHPDGPSLVYPATVNLPSQHLLPNPKTSHGLGDVFMRRDQSMETQEFRVTKDNMDKVFLPDEERESFMRSGNTCQGESLGRVRPPTSSSTQPDHTAMTDSQSSLDKAGKGRLPESYIKEITKNILKYLSLSTKDKGQGDSLKNESPPPSSVQTQEVVTKKQLLYTMVVEVQFLMNVVVQTLVNWLGINVRDPSKIQWSDIEPLASQLGRSSHSFMGLCDPKNSQPEKRMSGGLPSPEDHKHPFIYRGIRDKHQSGVNAQKTFAHHQYRAKRGTGFNQLPTPKENNHPCMYRVTGDKQEPDTATKSAHDQDLFRMKSAMGCYPHMSPKEHNHPIRKQTECSQFSSGLHRCDPSNREDCSVRSRQQMALQGNRSVHSGHSWWCGWLTASTSCTSIHYGRFRTERHSL
nr:uncharacterized protein LOC110563418 [Meriones unguiculatus]